MATAKQLRVWATMVRGWAAETADPNTAAKMLKLAEELIALAERKEVAERQFV
jgi:hypothetical protein